MRQRTNKGREQTAHKAFRSLPLFVLGKEEEGNVRRVNLI